MSTASGSGTGSGSGSIFAFFERLDLAPPAAFLFDLLAVDAFDIFDAIEVELVSMESSRSGISSPRVTLDCVDRRVEALEDRETLDDRDALPCLAFGRLEGAVVPAKTKKTQSGALR